MQHFQFILSILGVLAILAVLIHGYLVSRKEKRAIAAELASNDELLSIKNQEEIQDGIIGEVNIVRCDEEEEEICDLTFSQQDDETEEIKFSTEELDPESISLDNQHFVEHREEPEIEVTQSQVEIEEKQPEPQDHFIFNVAAKNGKYVRGHELLQFFLTAGFRFGDMSIFHRHLHSDGTGPILFSIANMMRPGIFEPEHMEQFQSEGVSFFLTVPNDEINVQEAFNMMVIAVEQMAEEFDCDVLNDKRQRLTTEEYRVYQERLLRYI